VHHQVTCGLSAPDVLMVNSFLSVASFSKLDGNEIPAQFAKRKPATEILRLLLVEVELS